MSKVAERLRAMGYTPLPRLWVTNEELELILHMAKRHGAVVNGVRVKTKQEDIAWKSKSKTD
jgi:hypothetical protein